MTERAFNAYQHEVRAILDGRQTQFRRVIKPQPLGEYKGGFIGEMPKCPYGASGDMLWVRETWVYDNAPDYSGDVLLFRADGEINGMSWRQSTHMPRWASRITLRVADVRVERVQHISMKDVLAEGLDYEEGVTAEWFNEGEHYYTAGSPTPGEKYAFIRLWDSTNAARGYGWDANPWVWVVEFEKVQP